MSDLFTNLEVGGQVLKSKVELDDILINLSNANDYSFDGETTFTVPSFVPPLDFSLGLIVGPSGTGKSSLLSCFGENLKFKPNSNNAVASQVDLDLLMTLGLSSIPSLCKPYHVLSNGEKHRVDLAYTIMNGGKVFDEFTSTVHRSLARTICISLKKYIDRNKIKNFVLSSCHEDIIEWLEPDWVFNTNTKRIQEWGLERQPIRFEINPCSYKAWEFFKNFHYLSSDINKSANCWVVHNDGVLAGFYSVLTFPNGYIKNAYRGHRLVIHPDFQGMGLSTKLSEYVASLHVCSGKRFFAKTAHPKLGQHRENSAKWKPTSKNKQFRLDYSDKSITKYDVKNKYIHKDRFCFSHEYVGT